MAVVMVLIAMGYWFILGGGCGFDPFGFVMWRWLWRCSHRSGLWLS